ncbi:MAG: hypothetical protein P8N92_05800 [Burkholderiales bacterium]|nr:hypothetical protein [Burkholderiales bacterium]
MKNFEKMISRPIRIALFFYQSQEKSTLTYQSGWPKSMMESSYFECQPINLAKLSVRDGVALIRQVCSSKFEAIVLLHSVFSNQKNLRGPLFWALAASAKPKVYFVGNEYKHMPEKMRFCRTLGVSLLITQSNDERVLKIYREALGCEVEYIPNTGVDQRVFKSTVAFDDRPVDIGYRSFASTWYLGNNEKSEIAEYFLINAERFGVDVDISLDPSQRFDAEGYAAFLNSCRFQLGTESGGDRFELSDHTRKAVNSFMKANPNVDWPEVKRRFFHEDTETIPMRIISGRQLEAAACRTAQILFEGRYGGHFEPDIHYIPLQKNFANVDEVIMKMRDRTYCDLLIQAAYDTAIAEFTYSALIAKFYRALRKVL